MEHLINCNTLMILKLMLWVIAMILLKKKFNNFKDSKRVNFIVIGSIIVLFIILQFQPEMLFIKFKTAEQNFRYYNPEERVLKSVQYEDDVYIISSNQRFLHYVKKDSKWKLVEEGKTRLKTFESYWISISQIPEEQMTAISVGSFGSQKEKIKVTDSLNTNFDSVLSGSSYSPSYLYIAIIGVNIDENYILKIGEKEAKLIN